MSSEKKKNKGGNEGEGGNVNHQLRVATEVTWVAQAVLRSAVGYDKVVDNNKNSKGVSNLPFAVPKGVFNLTHGLGAECGNAMYVPTLNE